MSDGHAGLIGKCRPLLLHPHSPYIDSKPQSPSFPTSLPFVVITNNKSTIQNLFFYLSPSPSLSNMSSEKNPLDLNNFPDEYMVGAHCERWRDGNQFVKDASIHPLDAAKCKKRKCGADEGKETCGKVYECRFCSLKFCKSQALGGHMNRHRQERETETLNRARQLVYGNDSLAPLNLGFRDPSMGAHAFSGSFHHDPSVAYVSSFTTRPSAPILSQSLHPFLYAQPPSSSTSSSSSSTTTSLPSSSSLSSHLLPFHSSYRLAATPVNDYIVGHVINSSPHRNHQQRNSSNQVLGVREFSSAEESMNYYQEQRGSWGYQDEQQ